MPKIVKYDEKRGIRRGEFVDDSEAIAQKVFTRLHIHRGEWDLDTTVGLPWKRWLQTKRPPVGEMRDEILREIGRTAGVLLVTFVSVDVDNETQTISFEFDVKVDNEEDRARRLRIGIRGPSIIKFTLELSANMTLGLSSTANVGV